VPSSWTDLERPPLSGARLSRALAGTRWDNVRVVAETVSTNADVASAARAGGAGEGLVVVAEHQAGGRGRLDRQWESPPRAAILMSALLRLRVPPSALSLVPLVAGLGVVEAVRSVGHVDATLKWPNDILAGDRKLAGILVERVDDAVVVGLGINVSTRRDELPVPTATSLALEGGATDREPLVKELLRALDRRFADYEKAGGEPHAVLPAYREVCATLGQRVSLARPDGGTTTGLAVDVDETGRLVVRDDSGDTTAWSAGDVVHVR
jgi:BirA family biotin operon repressor/biotin-[acetyl-CoA-carboxylase] ligase